MSKRTSSKDAILAAASEVVREHGAAHLTLDAVSAKAQVSKGGLLYHFPNKEALLLGMITRLVEHLESLRNKEESKLPDTPGRALKAHIRAMAAMSSPRVMSVLPALLAAGAQDPKLLKPAQVARAKTLAEFCRGGISKEFANVVLVAVDGMWLLSALGAAKHSHDEQQAITNELLRLVVEEELRLSERDVHHKR